MFFKEKNYQKAILSYTAGLKKKCGDQDLDTVLLTNRAAAHFYLGNYCLFTCHTDAFIALEDTISLVLGIWIVMHKNKKVAYKD